MLELRNEGKKRCCSCVNASCILAKIKNGARAKIPVKVSFTYRYLFNNVGGFLMIKNIFMCSFGDRDCRFALKDD